LICIEEFFKLIFISGPNSQTSALHACMSIVKCVVGAGSFFLPYGLKKGSHLHLSCLMHAWKHAFTVTRHHVAHVVVLMLVPSLSSAWSSSSVWMGVPTAGLWGGAAGILLLGLLCDYIDYRVIQCKRKLFGGRAIAYPDLAEATFGLWVVRNTHGTHDTHDMAHAHTQLIESMDAEEDVVRAAADPGARRLRRLCRVLVQLLCTHARTHKCIKAELTCWRTAGICCMRSSRSSPCSSGS
jgi:hypothetical protein